MRRVVQGIQGDGLADERRGLLKAAGLKRQDAQHMVGAVVRGVALKNLPAEPFRLLSVAAQVMSLSQVKQFGNRCHVDTRKKSEIDPLRWTILGYHLTRNFRITFLAGVAFVSDE